MTQLEKRAARLGVAIGTDGSYVGPAAKCKTLRTWCLANMYRRYIPEELLAMWGIRLNSEDPRLLDDIRA